MVESSDLLSFLRNLADHLALGTELNLHEVQGALNAAKANLEEVYARYDEPAPEGAEVIRDYMLEALRLFYRAIEEIEVFLEGGERERLGQAVLQAEEADDILSSIEYVIRENQAWTGQHSLG